MTMTCPETILSIKSSMKDQSCTVHSKNILQTEYFSKVSMEYLWVIWLLQPPTKNSNLKCVMNWSRNNCCLSSFPENVCSDLEFCLVLAGSLTELNKPVLKSQLYSTWNIFRHYGKTRAYQMQFAFRATDFLFHLRIVTYKNDLATMYCQDIQHTMVSSLQKL